MSEQSSRDTNHDDEQSDTGIRHLDARRTGWTIEDCVEEVKKFGDDPYNHYYYTTYSDVYHTNPDCPHIQNSESLHVASMLGDLNGPYSAGERVVFAGDGGDIDECEWCATHDTGESDGE